MSYHERVLAPTKSAWQVFRRFRPIMRPNRRLLVSGCLTLVTAAGCDTAAIWLFSSITDNALRVGDLSAFWEPALGWVGLALVAGGLSFAGQYWTALAGERFLLCLRDQVFAHVQDLSPDFFGQSRRGDLLSRLTSDVESVEALVGSGVVGAFTALVGALFYAVSAVLISWKLALVAFAVVPIFLLITRIFSRRVNDVARVERACHGELTSVLEENLGNAILVQAYNRQGTERERVHAHGWQWMLAKLFLVKMGAFYSPLVHIVQTVCVLAVVGVGTWQIAGHLVTIGGLFGFAAFLGYLYAPLQSLGQLTLTAAAATTGSARLIELLDTEPEVVDADGARDTGRATGEVLLDGVGFSYPDAQSRVLDGFSLKVGPGELLAVTGPSGAGKSTIAKLLLRLYDPQQGTVNLDGVDIRELPLRALRRDVTLLIQETSLLHGTIRDNIAYGRPEATAEQIVRAAIAADAHEFVQDLEDGYDTVLGDRGHRLSGGQRQRIAIARAMIADAPVLVLDEPTASLDADAATRVVEPLRRLAKGRTTIMVTHDSRLVALADRTVVLG